MRHCRLRLTFPEHVRLESVGTSEDYKLAYIRFLSCHVFGLVNHGQTWRGWERSREKGLIISDNQAQTWLIITINDTSIGDLPLIITISDTCKKIPPRCGTTATPPKKTSKNAMSWTDDKKDSEKARS